MKKPLPLVLAAFSAFLFQQQSSAQITLISNNTNITSGFVLPGNNKPVMLDDDGGLWTTDGTTATKITTAVTHPDTTSFAIYNNLMYFAGADATTQDVELWVTDGTSAGTKLIKNISSTGSSVPDGFFVLNNTLYFTANDGANGRELWKTNGAVGNASLVANINSGAASGLDKNETFFQNGNTIYFTATSGTNTGLWKIDLAGTPTLVKNITDDISLDFFNCANLGSKTVFTVRGRNPITGSGQLWVTDGTPDGTQMLKDFGIGSSSMIPQLTPFNGVLFFNGFQLTGNKLEMELWTTDGTPDNTKLFKDLDPDGSSSPSLLLSAIINGKLYFGATTKANGNELWSTDGTPAGTTIFKDINTRNSGKGNANPFFLVNIGAYVNQAIENNGNVNFQQAASTPFNGRWYFIANDGTHGQELWSTDGTSDGTHMVKDLNTNGDGVNAQNSAIYTTSGIYFFGNNGSTGTEPYITDGTDSGTKLVGDINTHGSDGSEPDFAMIYNNQIYLNADNGDNTQGNTVLYKIDQPVTVVLPVNLLTFNVALHNGSVALNWATASEVNTKNFVIERSTDGVHFTALNTVAAAGNSNTARQYQYNDAGAMGAGASTLYYRLRIVDNDGKYSYTAILPVQLQGGTFRITLSPNPVHGQLTVAFSTNNAKSITLRITDANGKTVYQQQFQTNGLAAMQQNINVSRFAAGAYFVQLITDKEAKTAKFVKQ